MKPNPSSLPPLPSNPVRRPSTPPPMERVRTQSRTAHGSIYLLFIYLFIYLFYEIFFFFFVKIFLKKMINNR